MQADRIDWDSPEHYLNRRRPDDPVLFLAPYALARIWRLFRQGFPGCVSYAVKANPDRAVLDNLVALGLEVFDVASPAEIAQVRAACPGAVLHYHNPVRSEAEIAFARDARVRSYSVDSMGELRKLKAVLADEPAEVAVRIKLPLKGASYDFGAKFGATPRAATALLRAVAAMGFTPSLTFHPGTQCTEPDVWRQYIRAASDTAAGAGIRPARLNVGGGFPSSRDGRDHDLRGFFDLIGRETRAAFAPHPPALVCEPGRALVSDALSLALRVKAQRGGDLFLNDGLYGTLSEQAQIGLTRRIEVIRAGAPAPTGQTRRWRIFGPTCDSLDMLKERVTMPAGIREGDYLLFHALGAYSNAMATGFNGYGAARIETVRHLDARARPDQAA